MTTRRLPDFIVAGVRKCGTTWLDQCLREHPGIHMPQATKELFFFDRYWSRGVNWYADYFAGAGTDQICGEVSPTYFTAPEGPARILETLPNVKLVFVFRDPVERVVSLYHHMRAKGDTALPLADAIDTLPELLEEGFYARYFAHYRDTFSEGVFPLILDDLQVAGEDALKPLFKFLGVDAQFQPVALSERAYERREARSRTIARMATGTSRLLHAMGLHRAVAAAKAVGAERIVMRKPNAPSEAVEPAIAARLHALYDDDIARLGDMLGRDLRELWSIERTPSGGGMRE
ncbi:MAG TPA: sulfotransferase domain-containing protein [Rhizomicrobium sp.]